MIAYEPGQPEFKQTKRTLMEFCEGKGVSNENECNINSSRSICMKLCNEMTDSCSIKLFEWKQTPAKLKKLQKRVNLIQFSFRANPQHEKYFCSHFRIRIGMAINISAFFHSSANKLRGIPHKDHVSRYKIYDL